MLIPTGGGLEHMVLFALYMHRLSKLELVTCRLQVLQTVFELD